MIMRHFRIVRPIAAVVAVLVILGFSNVDAFAGWHAVGNVTKISEQKKNGVVLETSSTARVSVVFFDANTIRVRVAPNGVFERGPDYAFDPSHLRTEPTVTVEKTSTSIIVKGPDGTMAIIQMTPFSVKIVDPNGETVVQDDKKHETMFDPETGEIQTTKLRRSEVETYYGFGEKAFAEMSRDGKYIVNWNTDTFSYPIGTDPIYESIPFFYALSHGKSYGLFFNNTYRTYFDMGKTSPERYTFGSAGGELDYFVFTGGAEHSPKNVMASYADLTGKTPLPPIWALGNQQSRWSYYPESRVREIATGFRKNKIPADVIYLDIDYMDGYRVFTWDKKRFPDPKKMVADLKADGFKTVLIIDPGIKVDENYSVYKDGQRNGIFVKNPDGSELNRDVWPQAAAFPDFTDPKARGWFGAQYKGDVEDGIAGFWNDMNEPGVFMNAKTEKPEVLHHPAKTFPLGIPHKGDGFPGTHDRYHNVFGMQMARSTFEGVSKLRPEARPFVLTRAGFAGVQRYSAVWTGDNYASWDHMALSIPMLANLSVSGVPFVGCDVGGFNDMPSGELYARWLQAAALTPFFRSHSVGWVGNKEPWEYGDEFTRINRQTVELRYRFLPYLYTLFREHERSGAPVMRPVWYEFPKDEMTYLISDQYMVGSDVMVAPVVKQGTVSREVYLPAGADWVNWWTGEKFEGGKAQKVDAPIDRLPIFVRVGAVIPTQAVIQNTTEMQSAPVTLNVVAGIAAGKTETSTLYEDSGDGYGYRGSDWKEVRVEHSRGSLKISNTGKFAGQQIRFLEIVGIDAKPKAVTSYGKHFAFTFDAATRRVKVELSGAENEILLVR